MIFMLPLRVLPVKEVGPMHLYAAPGGLADPIRYHVLDRHT
jgi:hypothetical protein